MRSEISTGVHQTMETFKIAATNTNTPFRSTKVYGLSAEWYTDANQYLFSQACATSFGIVCVAGSQIDLKIIRTYPGTNNMAEPYLVVPGSQITVGSNAATFYNRKQKDDNYIYAFVAISYKYDIKDITGLIDLYPKETFIMRVPFN